MTPARKIDWLTPAVRALSPERLQRYRRFVGGMKLLLPALAAGLVLVLMIWPSGHGPSTKPRALTAADSTMQTPVYTSRSEKGEPYRVTADKARQNPEAPGLTDVTNPTGSIVLEDGSHIEGDARRAQYDQNKGLLFLSGDLTLRHSSGAVFKTEKARVDMNARRASGDAPVKVTGDFGEVDAQGFRLRNQGKVVIFTGPSTARLKMGGTGKGSASSQGFLPSFNPAPPPSSGGGM